MGSVALTEGQFATAITTIPASTQFIKTNGSLSQYKIHLF